MFCSVKPHSQHGRSAHGRIMNAIRSCANPSRHGQWDFDCTTGVRAQLREIHKHKRGGNPFENSVLHNKLNQRFGVSLRSKGGGNNIYYARGSPGAPNVNRALASNGFLARGQTADRAGADGFEKARWSQQARARVCLPYK